MAMTSSAMASKTVFRCIKQYTLGFDYSVVYSRPPCTCQSFPDGPVLGRNQTGSIRLKVSGPGIAFDDKYLLPPKEVITIFSRY